MEIILKSKPWAETCCWRVERTCRMNWCTGLQELFLSLCRNWRTLFLRFDDWTPSTSRRRPYRCTRVRPDFIGSANCFREIVRTAVNEHPILLRTDPGCTSRRGDNSVDVVWVSRDIGMAAKHATRPGSAYCRSAVFNGHCSEPRH